MRRRQQRMMPANMRGYRTGGHFREDLRTILEQAAGGDHVELKRVRFIFDRFMHHLTVNDPEGWMLSGSFAFAARGIPHARHTKDIDIISLTRDASGAPISPDQAVERMRRAVGPIGDDFVSFEVRVVDATGNFAGRKLRVTALVAGAEYMKFKIDMSADPRPLVGEPEFAGPALPIQLPGLEQKPYRLLPLADHLAGKVNGIVCQLEPGMKSTRFKDLTDLYLVTRARSVSVDEFREALVFFQRQGLFPDHFDIPREVPGLGAGALEETWRLGVEKQLADMGLENVGFDEVLAEVKSFVDPALDGTAQGVWHPDRAVWDMAPYIETVPDGSVTVGVA